MTIDRKLIGIEDVGTELTSTTTSSERETSMKGTKF